MPDFPAGRSGWHIGNQDSSKRGLGKTQKNMGKKKGIGCPLSIVFFLIPLVVIAECIWGSFFS